MELTARAPESKNVSGPIELKEAEPGTFTGYASVFGKRDLQDEIVDAGAFKRTLKHKGDKLKLLWQHDPAQVLGVLSAEEDQKGLKVTRGEIFLGTSLTDYAYTMVKRGAVDGMSIGFRTIKDEWDKETGIRHIKEADLWEVSLVTFPANPAATVRTVKSGVVATQTRALLDAASDDEHSLSLACAHVMRATPDAKAAIPDDDMEFAIRYLDSIFSARGAVPPWAAQKSFDDYIASIKMISEHVQSDHLKSLRGVIDDQLNSRKPHFKWTIDTPGLDDDQLNSLIANLRKEIAPACAQE